MIFLDININEDYVIHIEKIRVLSNTVEIVFVTGLSNKQQDAFDVYAMNYLAKPIYQDKINEILQKCILLKI